MSWNETLSRMNWHQIENWLKQYEALGPVPGIVAPMVESYIPVLPLVAILVANVNAYGLAEGFLLSWIGVVLGSVSVFAIVRRFGGRIRGWIERKHPRSQRLIHWLETHGFTPVFVLACFPFTPSSLVNIVAGISRIPFHTFAVATALGKGVMIFLVSFAGHDIGGLLRQPWKIALVLGVFALMWLMGRKLEGKYFK
ncbi:MULTISPECIES: TVP38/TMEM64 family protein [Paenibacillus]|uniref:TVP38/TMEM64 family protein n=1 Tax=Paenibacillus TaxID=44249 RepID=UPI0022B90D1C|nr:TVP38/TMEM64 family protein [Paenibacillus caseinilyticus]MCZ8522146.1 TVP38/TMEM64 family protein [Paenibacillus caseinilyticus]